MRKKDEMDDILLVVIVILSVIAMSTGEYLIGIWAMLTAILEAIITRT